MISFSTPAGAKIYHDAEGMFAKGLQDEDFELDLYVPYIVEKMEIGSSWSYVYVKEFPGKAFNALWFVNDPLVPVSQNDDDSPWLGPMDPHTFQRVGL